MSSVIIRPDRDLLMDIGEVAFRAGKDYDASVYGPGEGRLSASTIAIDESDDEHELGDWFIHFTVVRRIPHSS